MTVSTRQALLTVAVAMLVVLAGCSGGDGGGDAADDTWDEGDSYTYSLNGSDRTISWTVDSLDGSTMTATVAVGDNSTRYRASTSAPFEGFRENLDSPFDALLVAPFAALHNYQDRLIGNHSLSANNTWTVQPPSTDSIAGGPSGERAVTPGELDSLRMDVVGTDTVAGTECTEVVGTPESGTAGEIRLCVNAEWPFPLSVGDGGPEPLFELTQYER
jgi:hypothetical protein